MLGAPYPILNEMRADNSRSSLRGAGELAIVDRIRRRAAPFPHGEVRVGIGDDCAVLRMKAGEEATITTDLSIENRHFRLASHPPESIGHRTLARGLSDIAAMGARPIAAFLSLGLPKNLITSTASRRSWLDRFLDGFQALADTHHTPLAGGDLAESPLALADIVVVGALPQGTALLRSGAHPGDLIYVTGALGGSAAGLRSIVRRTTGSLTPRSDLAPHLWPAPRVQQGIWLRKRGVASASIDISDGLSTEIEHLCAESGVSAEIDLRTLPIFPGAMLEDALHGGEDYELLFTAPPAAKLPPSIAGTPVTRIGKILKNRKGRASVALVDASGRRPLQRRGWEHFL